MLKPYFRESLQCLEVHKGSFKGLFKGIYRDSIRGIGFRVYLEVHG